MKYFKYSQFLYLIAGIVFGISATIKFFSNDDFSLQLIIAVGFIILYFVRSIFLKKMQNNQEKK
ncbi:hypothetical protein [Flavobacterium difficile]|uniref:C4-dicarboxylate ABC transporter n=1 Tax=Flavobacterium difficile TaxID=2709659 RepID=A0ABX0I792_9FLAO|nr:hypothetical protein [Flavobacterium difficile]NHM01694.1 hypothetical protein [Flavobacterium difficile]